ncbi:MAG: metallopeptidase family protein [Patescibacteria group bacterium]
MNLSKEEFKIIIKEGIRAIPEKFLNLLDNVDVVVEDEPSLAQRRKMRLRSDMTLFGLYEGIPRTKRGSGYSFVLPDKITIFQRPIEVAARDIEHLKKIVRDTVWHEFAHHFGIEEGRVRAIEAVKRKKAGGGN